MTPRLILASASPRRSELLKSAGFDARVCESDLDDGDLVYQRVRPEAFVVSLSWFKASRVMQQRPLAGAVVLAADTMCVCDDAVLGKPQNERDAREMLVSLRGRVHRTVTGVTAVDVDGRRHMFVDVARVALGAIDDAAIDAYVATGAWRGKAGGYNYSERVAAGWPVSCDGDPTSVMGLPMTRVVPLLESLGVARREPHP
ncbi:MAG: nucleoside triphosphate pyrophosphatase [Phycisphaerae bacterium]|nr:nucleoside triphosphate pyrophosphatase [Phycisphaerae bacterium]